MDSALGIGPSTILPMCSSTKLNQTHINRISYGFRFGGNWSITGMCAIFSNGSASASASLWPGPSSVRDVHKQRGSLESLFCYDNDVPEERIEKPIGISLAEKAIGDSPRCADCQAKGAVLCTTCTGSGLYVDSILESQGIIVKVRCLGCGGTGNIMCSKCGGRGHLGTK